jgi:ParB family chromosome partitioning protein
MSTKKGLGRGLESLFGFYEEDKSDKNITTQSGNKEVEKKSVSELDINKLYPNPNQPRKYFDDDALQELANSIKIHGVIQPIIVNKEEGDKYLIIAGERRWRASRIAGLSSVPVVIKNYTEKQVKEVSLIENLQREDLNPIEAARAIKQLMEEYNFTQEAVADRIGKSRPNITNTLRLLTLYPDVIKMVEDGRLSSGHARALVVVEDTNQQIRLAKNACDGKMSVRDLEKAVKNYLNPAKKLVAKVAEQSLELKELITDMQRVFATKVSAIGNDNKGRIYIDYYSRDDLDRLADMIELLKKKEITLADLRNYNKRNKNQ